MLKSNLSGKEHSVGRVSDRREEYFHLVDVKSDAIEPFRHGLVSERMASETPLDLYKKVVGQ